jgi:hypothetical protein
MAKQTERKNIMTDNDLTKFIDEYFDARPQLTRPAKHNLLVYELERTIKPLLESLYFDNQILKKANQKLIDEKNIQKYRETHDAIAADLEKRNLTIGALICNNKEGKKIILGYDSHGVAHFISEPANCLQIDEQLDGRTILPIATIGRYVPKTVNVNLDLDKPLKAGNDKPKSTFWSYFKFTRKTK